MVLKVKAEMSMHQYMQLHSTAGDAAQHVYTPIYAVTLHHWGCGPACLRTNICSYTPPLGMRPSMSTHQYMQLHSTTGDAAQHVYAPIYAVTLHHWGCGPACLGTNIHAVTLHHWGGGGGGGGGLT